MSKVSISLFHYISSTGGHAITQSYDLKWASPYLQSSHCNGGFSKQSGNNVEFAEYIRGSQLIEGQVKKWFSHKKHAFSFGEQLLLRMCRLIDTWGHFAPVAPRITVTALLWKALRCKCRR